ncbi:hypothetical protein TSUD_52240 [Trifolium subterraneum]|uniref:Uncharacterized protein n=1 Tax=Trifolium subterraneum TaxID=3900 RepID=A0A2Z6P3Y9_TRISU|nr:hypothetical protein TSUD_52240 [Trifolium subterraneum]
MISNILKQHCSRADWYCLYFFCGNVSQHGSNGVSVSDGFLKSPSPLVKEFHGVARSESVLDGFLKSSFPLVKEFNVGVARLEEYVSVGDSWGEGGGLSDEDGGGG